MENNSENPDVVPLDDQFYAGFDRLLREAGAELGAAQVHGLLTGVACAGNVTTEALNTLVLLKDDDPEASSSNLLEDALAGLLGLIERDLNAPDLGYGILLPGDSAPIANRIQAIADWCQGFLIGLGKRDGLDLMQIPGEAGEAVRDMMTISQLEDDDDDLEDKERSLAEIEEFLKIGVQLVYEELHPARSNPTASG